MSSSLRGEPATFEGGAAVTVYQITLRDRETRTVLGYYDGAWTTDRRRALALRRREAAEAHAARMRDRRPRNGVRISRRTPRSVVIEEVRFASDSPVEQAGFEPSVPHLIGGVRRAIGKAADKLREAPDAA